MTRDPNDPLEKMLREGYAHIDALNKRWEQKDKENAELERVMAIGDKHYKQVMQMFEEEDAAETDQAAEELDAEAARIKAENDRQNAENQANIEEIERWMKNRPKL